MTDQAFAAAAKLTVDYLLPFDAGEEVPDAATLAAMLKALWSTRRQEQPGFADHAQEPLQQNADEQRFSETVELIRAFSAVSSHRERQRILALVLECAGK